MEILRIENLDFSYALSSQKVLKNINLSINSGEIVLLCGKSGCGKTTLLKMLKKEIMPKGELRGTVLLENQDINLVEEPTKIGFVMQNPESSIVTDKVWHELSFGLESCGYSNEDIRMKVAEIAEYFGLADKINCDTAMLSGGEKQLLNLAAVTVSSPKILLLDEPTSRLDPIAAEHFINTLIKLNKENGITIIIAEHRSESLFESASKVVYMEDGTIKACENPVKFANDFYEDTYGFLPSAAKIFGGLTEKVTPLNVAFAKNFLRENFNNTVKSNSEEHPEIPKNTLICVKDIWFRYEKEMPDVIKGLSLNINSGEVFTLAGANGSGKSTFLKLLSGLSKPFRGSIIIQGEKVNSKISDKFGYLPQNPLDLFIKNTVIQDYADLLKSREYSEKESQEQIEKIVDEFNIKDLINSHPYDLSGGEQQKCAFAKIMLSNPSILLLDEPTKGLDYYAKQEIINIIKNLSNKRKTIIIVSHDIDFIAKVSDRCTMLFNGSTLPACNPTEFCLRNNFYTTSAKKISDGFFENTIIDEKVRELCKINGVKK